MPALMADNDSRGHFAVILLLLESDAYSERWGSLGFEVADFKELGLPADAPDMEVWRACQERQVVLVTSNRNGESSESLEVAIRIYNDASCLPVITLADPRRLMKSKSYALRVVERLLDHLQHLDDYRGVGRLYMP